MIVYNIKVFCTLLRVQSDGARCTSKAFATLCKGNTWVAKCQVNMSFFGKRT